MAAWASASATPVVASDRNPQPALSNAFSSVMAQAWRLIEKDQTEQSVRNLVIAATALVQQHAQAARALANESYQSARARAGVSSLHPFTPQPTQLPHAETVEAYVRKALESVQSDPTALDVARKNATGMLEKLVADTGRQQTVDNALADRQATGWAREAQPDACWFCAMLATRGAVYHSAEAAGLTHDADGLPANSYHAHCHCQVVPVFGKYEPPAHIRAWQKMWADSTKHARGADKAWAFQEAFEGRKIKHRTKKWNGYGRKNGRPTKPRQPKSQEAQVGIAEQMTVKRAQDALAAAKRLYLHEGDPVGDRATWIRVLESRLGVEPEKKWFMPAPSQILDGLSGSELKEALANAERLLGDSQDPTRLAWIAALKRRSEALAVHA